MHGGAHAQMAARPCPCPWQPWPGCSSARPNAPVASDGGERDASASVCSFLHPFSPAQPSPVSPHLSCPVSGRQSSTEMNGLGYRAHQYVGKSQSCMVSTSQKGPERNWICAPTYPPACLVVRVVAPHQGGPAPRVTAARSCWSISRTPSVETMRGCSAAAAAAGARSATAALAARGAAPAQRHLTAAPPRCPLPPWRSGCLPSLPAQVGAGAHPGLLVTPTVRFIHA